MKKISVITSIVVCLALIASVAVLGANTNIFENLSYFKNKTVEIDNRLDNNLDNPEEYEKAMNESLAIFNDPQYEEMANKIIKEQEESREYLQEYLSDVKCALVDSKKGYNEDDPDGAKKIAVLDKQIQLYEKLEKVVAKADDKSIGYLSRKIKDITKAVQQGEEMPALTDDISLMIEAVERKD